MLLIDRAMLSELVRPFVMGAVGFVVINLVNTLFLFANLIVQSGVSVPVVGLLLLYSIPPTLVITFPVAYMFATLLVIGRMARDGELVAYRAAGVGFKRILLPLLLGSVVASLAGFWVNDDLTPWANSRSTDLQLREMQHQQRPILKTDVFFTRGQRYFYVRQVDRRTNMMYGVSIIDREGGVTAREARWVGRTWELRDGVRSHGDGATTDEEAFQRLTVEVDEDPEAFFRAGDRQSVEKPTAELRSEIQALEAGGSDVRALKVDYYLKYSLPFATTFAALLAAPLGALFSRFGGFIGVVLSMVLLFAYMMLMTVSRALGVNGLVDPVTGAWLQDYLFGAVGLYLLWRVDR